MVCPRCIRVVNDDLTALQLPLERVEMGIVWMKKELTTKQAQAMQEVLEASGFEIIENREDALVEEIKKLITEYLFGQTPKANSLNFSDYLMQKTNVNYGQLSRLFSTTTRMTIEQFIIIQKIERVKELMKTGEKNLSEISLEMQYSSPQHLSTQFKKVTGMTPTAYKLRQLED